MQAYAVLQRNPLCNVLLKASFDKVYVIIFQFTEHLSNAYTNSAESHKICLGFKVVVIVGGGGGGDGSRCLKWKDYTFLCAWKPLSSQSYDIQFGVFFFFFCVQGLPLADVRMWQTQISSFILIRTLCIRFYSTFYWFASFHEAIVIIYLYYCWLRS